MKILGQVMASLVMLLIVSRAINYHKLTVCRQKAWLKSFELESASRLNSPHFIKHRFESSCLIKVSKSGPSVLWFDAKNLKLHRFDLSLKGNL